MCRPAEHEQLAEVGAQVADAAGEGRGFGRLGVEIDARTERAQQLEQLGVLRAGPPHVELRAVGAGLGEARAGRAREDAQHRSSSSTCQACVSCSSASSESRAASLAR